MSKNKNRKKIGFSSIKLTNIDPKTKHNMKFLLALVLISVGFIFLGKYSEIKSPKQELNISSSVSIDQHGKENGPIRVSSDLLKEENTSLPPVRILIPKVQIDLNVTESAIKNGEWETSETTASHGIGSANPGELGNSVVFAHARQGLFYNLREVSKKDIVYVFTHNKWYAYEVLDIKTVQPDEIEVVAPTKDETLTLYTCTGYSDENRLIVTAKPIKTDLQTSSRTPNGESL